MDSPRRHPYRGSAPESVVDDYAAIRALTRRYLPANRSVPPLISGEWGYATCFTSRGDPAPCIGGATGGATISRAQQAAFLARQWLVNAMEGIPLSIWYDWSDGNNCVVTDGPSDDCYGVFENASSTADEAAHGPPKPAYDAAVAVQALIGPRPFVSRLRTSTPPSDRTVEAGDDPIEGSKCLSINTQVQRRTDQDASTVYALGFGAARHDAPPAAAQPGATIEALYALPSHSCLLSSRSQA